VKISAAALILSGLTYSAGLAAVCFPDQDYSVAAEYGKSVVVVVGTVTGKQRLPEPNAESPDSTLYHLKVSDALKGTPSNRISVWSENRSGRFPMVVGRSYLLFLYDDGTHMVVNNCGNSGLASETRHVRRVLDEIRAVR
jgi:hypothetical protein